MSLRVAFLGPEGTYTHQAVDEYFDDYAEVACPSLNQVMEAEADARLIPFENSVGGGVGEAIDLLREHDAEVTGEHAVRINHVLASAEEDISDIQQVRSHPQALSQCRDFLRQKGWKGSESSSTAKAAEEIGEGEAAICSRLAAEMNDLNIMLEGIQDSDSNTTRFFILGEEDNGEGEKTSLVLEPGVDRPGLLESMLSCFSGHGINLAYIQSRPTRDELGNYYFYIEAEADRREGDFQRAIRCLETYADVKILGSYSRS